MYIYEKYPVDSEAYVILKRKTAWDIARKDALSDGIDIDSVNFSIYNSYYYRAYLRISLIEYERNHMTNNYRRRHGVPMRRKVR